MSLPVAGILDPIVDLMESIILFFHDDAGFGWGMAIIGLTFVVRLAVLPLSIRGIRSMRRLQVLAPQMKAIQEKYKDDRERQQRETMNFYRENKINPFSSCLPFLLQIPFFIGIYELLRGDRFKSDVEASGNPGWLGINSLIENPSGAEAAVLIVLFIGTTIPTFLLTMSAQTTVNRTQRYLFMLFPVMIAPFMLNLPAGLSVYWIATNIWSLGQQAVVQRLMPAAPTPAPEEVKAAKPPPPPPRKKKRRR
jgi:YidC/Oxa1 family membrane protein insertase